MLTISLKLVLGSKSGVTESWSQSHTVELGGTEFILKTVIFVIGIFCIPF